MAVITAVSPLLGYLKKPSYLPLIVLFPFLVSRVTQGSFSSVPFKVTLRWNVD